MPSSSMLQLETTKYPSACSTPRLPFELVCAVIEQAFAEFSIVPPGGPDNVASPIPQYLLTLNRSIHALVVRLAYRTIVISSSRSLGSFFSLVSRSPHLASLVRNLWIGTSQLETFDHQFGWAPCVIAYVLTRLPGLERLALPAAFLPPGIATSETPVKHITCNGGSAELVPSEVETLHLYGLIDPCQVQQLTRGALMRIVCELRRPAAPGAVGCAIRESLLYADKECRDGFRLEFVVPKCLLAWMEEEMSQVVVEDVAKGSLVVRVGKAQGGKSGTLREEWVEKWNAF